MGTKDEQQCQKIMATVAEELWPLHILAYVASKELEKINKTTGDAAQNKRGRDEEEADENEDHANEIVNNSAKNKRQRGMSGKKAGNKKVQLPPYNLLPNVPHHRRLLETVRLMGGGEMVYLSGKQVTWSDLNKDQNRLLVRGGPTVETTLRGLLGEEEMRKIMRKQGMGVQVIDRRGHMHGEDPKRQLVFKHLECNGAFRLIGPGIAHMLESIGLRASVHYMHLFALVLEGEPRQLMLAIVEEDLPQAAHEEGEDEDAGRADEPADEEDGKQFKELK